MKCNLLTLIALNVIFLSCTGTRKEAGVAVPLQGTWTLISGTTDEKGKITTTYYTKDQRMIKIINDTHFAFLKHALKPDSAGKNNFDAGGGTYTLSGDEYKENLEYYNDRNWEGKSFSFKVKIQNDTLIQTGVEKVEGAGIDRIITEKYLRTKSMK